jgi:hypothetical protein
VLQLNKQRRNLGWDTYEEKWRRNLFRILARHSLSSDNDDSSSSMSDSSIVNNFWLTTGNKYVVKSPANEFIDGAKKRKQSSATWVPAPAMFFIRRYQHALDRA